MIQFTEKAIDILAGSVDSGDLVRISVREEGALDFYMIYKLSPNLGPRIR